jgi:hypothetical protein
MAQDGSSPRPQYTTVTGWFADIGNSPPFPFTHMQLTQPLTIQNLTPLPGSAHMTHPAEPEHSQ